MRGSGYLSIQNRPNNVGAVFHNSSDAVTGPFAQRELDVLGVPYAIATNGGDGNDVTLIVRDGTIMLLR